MDLFRQVNKSKMMAHALSGRPQSEEHKARRLISFLRNGKLKGKIPWNKGITGKFIKDIKGQRFGRLFVLEYAGIYRSPKGGGRAALWKCQCECGQETIVQRSALISGAVVSCGCLNKENAQKLGLSNIGNNNGMFGQIDHFKRMGCLSVLKQSKSKKPTSIEKIVYDFLLEKGIIFERQKLIKGKFLVDAYIPGTNTVVEVDGVYWHGLERTVKKDKAENAYLKECGYNLLRLSETEVKDGSFRQELLTVAAT